TCNSSLQLEVVVRETDLERVGRRESPYLFPHRYFKRHQHQTISCKPRTVPSLVTFLTAAASVEHTVGRAGGRTQICSTCRPRMAWHRVASHQPSTLIKGPKPMPMWPLQHEDSEAALISHRTPDWLVAVID
ncbi:hypothetical protein CTAM01_12125, partial [Colletotrichum tamarilloi]